MEVPFVAFSPRSATGAYDRSMRTAVRPVAGASRHDDARQPDAACPVWVRRAIALGLVPLIVTVLGPDPVDQCGERDREPRDELPSPEA